MEKIWGVNIFQKYKVNAYLGDTGLICLPFYRGKQIGKELLLARDGICQAHGLRATSSLFTSTRSSTIASKAGFVLDKNIELVMETE